jgi:glycosyltransferase involved in cell wall biosynthesis
MIVVADGPALIVEEAGAVVVEPEDAEGLAAALKALAAEPEPRAEIDPVGRGYAEDHCDRARLAERYRSEVLVRVAGGGR